MTILEKSEPAPGYLEWQVESLAEQLLEIDPRELDADVLLRALEKIRRAHQYASIAQRYAR